MQSGENHEHVQDDIALFTPKENIKPMSLRLSVVDQMCLFFIVLDESNLHEEGLSHLYRD